jgi:RNA polymerase sigma factor (sigma-70 family)
LTHQEIEEIFKTQDSKLKGYLYNNFNRISREEREDILQETYMTLLSNPHRFDTKRDTFPLLCQMVKMRALGRIRHSKMADTKYESIYIKYTEPHTHISDPASILRIEEELTNRQAEIFHLFVQGYSYTEIMDICKIAKQTVNTTLARVREILRSIFSLHTHQDHPIHQYQNQ